MIIIIIQHLAALLTLLTIILWVCLSIPTAMARDIDKKELTKIGKIIALPNDILEKIFYNLRQGFKKLVYKN